MSIIFEEDSNNTNSDWCKIETNPIYTWNYEKRYNNPVSGYVYIKGLYDKKNNIFIGGDICNYKYECNDYKFMGKIKFSYGYYSYLSPSVLCYNGIITLSSGTKYQFKLDKNKINQPFIELKILDFPTKYEPDKWNWREFEIWIYDNKKLSEDDYLNFIANFKGTTVDEFRKKYCNRSTNAGILNNKGSEGTKLYRTMMKIINELDNIKKPLEDKKPIKKKKQVDNFKSYPENNKTTVAETSNYENEKNDNELEKYNVKKVIKIICDAYIKQLDYINITNDIPPMKCDLINKIRDHVADLYKGKNEDYLKKSIKEKIWDSSYFVDFSLIYFFFLSFFFLSF